MADQTFKWYDPNGVVTFLSDSHGYRPLVGPQGRFMPPVSLRERSTPGQAGTQIDSIQVLPRDVDVPLLVFAPNSKLVRQKIDELLVAMDPTRGDGRLQIIRPNGDARELRCRLASGMEGDEGFGQGFPGAWQRFVLTMHAADPYWYSSSSRSITLTVATGSTFFPIFPLMLGSSTVFSNTTVVNGGDVSTWPIWKVTGPGTDLVLQNVTTGESLSIDHDLAAGENIQIDTRPGYKSVRDGAGNNLFGDLLDDASLWALAKGSNRLSIQLAGATSASAVQLTFTERYLGA